MDVYKKVAPVWGKGVKDATAAETLKVCLATEPMRVGDVYLSETLDDPC